MTEAHDGCGRERACSGRGRGGIPWDPPRYSRPLGSGRCFRSCRVASFSGRLDPRPRSSASRLPNAGRHLASPEVFRPGAGRLSAGPGLLFVGKPDSSVAEIGESRPAGATLPHTRDRQLTYFLPVVTQLETSPMGPLSSFLGAPGAVGGPGRLFPELGPQSLDPILGDGGYARRVRPRRPEGRRPVHLARAWAVAAGPRGRGEGVG
jgi:hypothetical protein